jgi:hypothetical protein
VRYHSIAVRGFLAHSKACLLARCSCARSWKVFAGDVRVGEIGSTLRHCITKKRFGHNTEVLKSNWRDTPHCGKQHAAQWRFKGTGKSGTTPHPNKLFGDYAMLTPGRRRHQYKVVRATACARTWSAFDHIHTASRNRMKAEKAAEDSNDFFIYVDAFEITLKKGSNSRTSNGMGSFSGVVYN